MLKRIRVLFLALVFTVLGCMPAFAAKADIRAYASYYKDNNETTESWHVTMNENVVPSGRNIGDTFTYSIGIYYTGWNGRTWYLTNNKKEVIKKGTLPASTSQYPSVTITGEYTTAKFKDYMYLYLTDDNYNVGDVISTSVNRLKIVVVTPYPDELVTGVYKLSESAGENNSYVKAGVNPGEYYIPRRQVIHGGKIVSRVPKYPDNHERVDATITVLIKVPCGVKIAANGKEHEYTSSNCHLNMNIPTVGNQDCGHDRSYWSRLVDDTWKTHVTYGSQWFDGTNDHYSGTHDYIWNWGIYHGDSDNDGLCDGCGQPTDGMDLSHTHNFVQKYYDHNGVPDAYWVYECECGEQQDGVKHFTQFTINFDVNGGQGSFTNLTINAGDTVNIPNVEPTRTGYIFKGWSTTRNGNKEYDKGQQVIPKKSTTYYAVWEGKKYKISFETAGSGTVNEIQVTYGSPIGTLPSPVTNTRWRTEDGTFVTSTTIYNWDENITLYLYEDAVLHAVTFIGGSQSQIVHVKDGTTVDPPFDPAESGYVFKWWSTSRTGSAFDFTTPIKSDMTLYAVMEGSKVIITLPGCGEKEYTYPSQIGELPVPTQPNAEFDGWYWDAEYTQPVSPDEQVPMYDTPLYPKFNKEQYTVELEGYDPLIISKGDYIPKLPTPERPGETFLGWFMGDTEIKQGDLYEWDYAITVKPKFETNTFMITLPNGEIRVVHEGDSIGDIPTGVVQPGTRVTGFKNQYGEIVDSSTRVYGDLTITPVIERDRITLTLMDGDTQYNVIDVDAGLKITDLPTLSKEGYTFRGWSTMKGGSVTMGPFITDTTLHAVYAAEKQTIVLGELNQTVEKLTGSQIGSLPAPVKDGYEFNGWLWNGNHVTAETVVPPGGMTLTPSWEKVVVDTTRFVTIRYWSDNIRINTVDMNPGEILYNPGEPALDILKERTFAYWANRDGSVYEFGHRISSDLDLYAVWQ